MHRLTHSKLSLICLTSALCACGGGGSSNGGGTPTPPPPAVTTTISGSVSAPGGAIAFNPPTGIYKFFAEVFGSPAVADIPGSSTVGAGVTINLIQIDANSNQVGSPLATTTTDSIGNYSLNAPDGFVPGPQYVIRAEGTGASSIDAMVTGTSVTVDPSTQATETLILGSISGTQLTTLTSGSVTALQSEVNQVILDAGLTSSSGTVSTVVADINNAGANSETVTNLATSLGQSGIITGNVTDTSGNAIVGVKVLARDYNNWVTRAATLTDTSGNYTLNVPPGKDYIVGATNATTNPAASAWWTSACTTACNAANQFKADKVSVAGSAVMVDFKLPAGIAVSGKITNTIGNTGLAGIKVLLRDFTNDQPASGVYTDSNGNYRINMLPGTYTLAAVNQVSGSPYGGIYYSSGPGTDSTQASPLTLTSGSQSINLALPVGHMVSGSVTDPSSGTAVPVTGIPIRIYSEAADTSRGAFVQAVRTDLAGHYQIVLPDSLYIAMSRGQSVLNVDNTSADVAVNFTDNVGMATATIIDTSGNPIGQAKVFVWKVDTNTGTAGANSSGTPCNPGNVNAYCFTYISNEASSSDGSVTFYAPDSTLLAANQSYVIQAKLDGGQTTLGTVVYDTANNTNTITSTGTLAAGTPITFTAGSTNALGNFYLPPGGELTGKVTDTTGTTPYANAVIQVRTSTGGNSRVVTTRTMVDGSYSISLPAGTYNVCAMTTSNAGGTTCGSTSSPGVYMFQAGITVNANSVNTQDFQY